MVESWIKKRLTKVGYRLTRSRKTIISYILQTKGIFSAQDLIDALLDVDRVAVYRTLDVLEQVDAVHTVTQRDGSQYYELHHPTAHHHHITCIECSGSKCVPCDIEEKTIPGFRNIHHTVHLTGVCSKCSSI
ncbi:MAG: transcriptional repressor [Candidatus Magasanikbacteria bacterium]|jgi:Fur family transcriptional regulator, ferric uptake regulator|nr:transcriptional repressor [Candidatus Magasanikbacteria bacterium]MBT4221360.1 transcriptional repressor [Candidatus Magasanikbacteria bacterium]MBT4350792.1 transcriptional repressor [Candidatus Magasanikbacteria bacterium]MBT4541532.1 transcriptional repressor [Candidatus Magasanikbacteria bacterium]MBT6253484.1 transcriptional repressor [Candidatus Magasanikbacteria bacterium]